MPSTGWLTANLPYPHSPGQEKSIEEVGLACCSAAEASSLKCSKFSTQDSQTSGGRDPYMGSHESELCKTTQGSEAQHHG